MRPVLVAILCLAAMAFCQAGEVSLAAIREALAAQDKVFDTLDVEIETSGAQMAATEQRRPGAG